MKHVLDDLISAHASGRSVVFTALVETRGSTPQKPGAGMLVFDDGNQTGTLGGGCVEAEVKRTALEILQDGRARILSFQLDHDYGWDDGLICGGRMTMLVAPVRPGDDVEYYRAYQATLERGSGCTEVLALDAEAEVIERYLFDIDENVIATMSGNPPPDAVREALRPLLERPRPYVMGGYCFLPHLNRCRLLIVGAGHVGQQLAKYAAEVDFDVWVFDDREFYCNAERIPEAQRHIVGGFDDVLPDLPVDGDTLAVIVTRGHNHDEEALFHLINRGARYVGMIGSRRKIRLIFDHLKEQGISEAAIESVHAPVGFDIGSQTVPEIAISIVAELIACRNGRR